MVAKPAALHYDIASYTIDTSASPACWQGARGGGGDDMVGDGGRAGAVGDGDVVGDSEGGLGGDGEGDADVSVPDGDGAGGAVVRGDGEQSGAGVDDDGGDGWLGFGDMGSVGCWSWRPHNRQVAAYNFIYSGNWHTAKSSSKKKIPPVKNLSMWKIHIWLICAAVLEAKNLSNVTLPARKWIL
jgi:hypothetical protein